LVHLAAAVTSLAVQEAVTVEAMVEAMAAAVVVAAAQQVVAVNSTSPMFVSPTPAFHSRFC
jgi:hypothetical protein